LYLEHYLKSGILSPTGISPERAVKSEAPVAAPTPSILQTRAPTLEKSENILPKLFSSMLRWRYLRPAAIIVSLVILTTLLTILAVYVYTTREALAKMDENGPVSYRLGLQKKEYEKQFYDHMAKESILDKANLFYRHYFEDDSNFHLTPVEQAPADLKRVLEYAKYDHTIAKVDYLATDSYLELIKRISMRESTTVVLFPYHMRDGNIYFTQRPGQELDLMAFPVSRVTEDGSRVGLARLVGPF
jgi:hypothetical protein